MKEIMEKGHRKEQNNKIFEFGNHSYQSKYQLRQQIKSNSNKKLKLNFNLKFNF